jgi:ABC-type amino acid transport substrate-binding protein
MELVCGCPQNADIVVGDVTITASRMAEVDFTMPFTTSGWSMVVPVKTDTSTSMWIFLQPLSTSLWLASIAFFCFTGFVVWVIEHRINPEFRGTPWQQFGLTFYFAFSTLVFSHSMFAVHVVFSLFFFQQRLLHEDSLNYSSDLQRRSWRTTCQGSW